MAALALSFVTSSAPVEGGGIPRNRESDLALREASQLFAAGKRKAGLALLLAKLKAARARHGKGSAELVPLLWVLQQYHLMSSDFVRSGDVLREIARIQEKTLGPNHLDLVPVLKALARDYSMGRDHERATALQRRILVLQEKAHGPESREVATTLDLLGLQFMMRGSYREGDAVLDRALMLKRKLFGRSPSRLATYLETRGAFFEMRYAYARAEQLYRESLKLRSAQRRPRMLVATLSRLAWLHWRRGNPALGVKVLKRILNLYQTMTDPDGQGRAAFLEQLGQMYRSTGSEADAQSAFAEAGKIRLAYLKKQEQSTGPVRAILVRTALQLLASHYQTSKEVKLAAPVLKRLVSMARAGRFGGELAVAAMEMQYGKAEEALGHFKSAEKLYLSALDAYRSLLGGSNVQAPQLFLSVLYHKQKRFVDATKIEREVLASYERGFGQSHVNVAGAAHRLAVTLWARGELKEALALLRRAEEIYERHLSTILLGGTEQDRRKFLADVRYQIDNVLSFHLWGMPRSGASARLAMRLVLRRKGRLLDAVADAAGKVQRRLRGPVRKLFVQLRAVRARLARLAVGRAPGISTAERLAKIAALDESSRWLQSKISALSPLAASAVKPATIAGVQRRIGPDAALVEYASYLKIDPRASGDPQAKKVRHYAACVLGAKGEPRCRDLGEAASIDRRVQSLRRAIGSLGRLDAGPRALALARQIFRPLRPLLGKAKRVLVSPDGSLNVVPFAALVDEKGRYLLEDFSFTYLTSGRDLLRMGHVAAVAKPPVVVANPDFGKRGAPDSAPKGKPAHRGLRSIDLLAMRWQPLPASAQEARELRAYLPGSLVLTGKEATEARVKRLGSPSILHLATHGFFLPVQQRPATVGKPAPSENPLLRSGLVLGGANQRDDGSEDGILTALEAADLELSGTRLVVLSACETGQGEIRLGDGVYGLRRALVISGAASQLMSLWRVEDRATRQLMVGFYRRLHEGLGRAEALRQSQLELLKASPYRHPFFWAAFIQSGDWRPIETVAAKQPMK